MFQAFEQNVSQGREVLQLSITHLMAVVRIFRIQDRSETSKPLWGDEAIAMSDSRAPKWRIYFELY